MLVEGVDGDGEELWFRAGDGGVEDEEVTSSVGALFLGKLGVVSKGHPGGGDEEKIEKEAVQGQQR
jgi:hypothetical protein